MIHSNCSKYPTGVWGCETPTKNPRVWGCETPTKNPRAWGCETPTYLPRVWGAASPTRAANSDRGLT